MINILELTEICGRLGCKYSTDCSLSEHTTFKIGGVCSFLIEINSANSAAELVKYLRTNEIKYTILGKGSNIIASDKGYDGVILHFGKDFSNISVNGTTVCAAAGASLAAVCRKAQENGLSGMENLYGIPGSVGGGLYMNAGAYGREMKDVVFSAEYIDDAGNICTIFAEDMKLSYRHSIFSEKKCIITSVVFELTSGESEKINKDMAECMQKRITKQPLEYPSAGSTFKRPEGYFAGKLIMDAGLRGFTVGGAQVSEKHCGFVINKGDATAKDVVDLITQVQEKVQETFGVTLETEVKMIGFK